MSTVDTLYEETVKRGFAKLLSSQFVISAASISFIAPFAAAEVDKYSSYVFSFEGITLGTDGAVLYMRMSKDNGASWMQGVGDYGWQWSYYGSTVGPAWFSAYNQGAPYTQYLQFIGGAYGPPGYAISGQMAFANSTSPTINNFEFWIDYLPQGSGTMYAFRGSGANNNSAIINGVQFYVNTGLMSGTIRLFGLRKGA